MEKQDITIVLSCRSTMDNIKTINGYYEKIKGITNYNNLFTKLDVVIVATVKSQK